MLVYIKGCQTSLSAKGFPWFCYQNRLCPWSIKYLLSF